MRAPARLLACSIATAMMTCTSVVLAQSGAARADALFREGQALMTKGDLNAACPKLADSYALDPALGTLLNLAYCHQKQGRFFTAWTEFVKGEQIAIRTEQQDRASFAADHRQEVAARLPRARLVVASGARITALRLDGHPYEAALDPSTPIVVPPGTHELAIETSDGKKASTSATFPDTGAGAPTEVRFNDDGARPSEPAKPPAQATTPAVPENGGSEGSTQKTIGYVVGGVGIVALGVGTYFGIATFSQKDEAAKGCSPAGCTPDGKREGDLAYDYATLSTVFVVAGALATAAGVYLVLAAPSSSTPSSTRASVFLGFGGAGVRGAF